MTVLSGTRFHVSDIQIVTDEDAMVPPATVGPPMKPGQTTVAAHAVEAGPAGNITALAIDQVCCGSPSITADNQNAFTGGTDTVDYNYLKPEDLTKAINDSQSIVKVKAQNDVKGQIKAGDQRMGDINCDPAKTTEDIQPNVPQATTITTAHVTVSVTCKLEVFAPMSFV